MLAGSTVERLTLHSVALSRFSNMPQGRYSKLCSVAEALPMSFSRPMTVFTFSV